MVAVESDAVVDTCEVWVELSVSDPWDVEAGTDCVKVVLSRSVPAPEVVVSLDTPVLVVLDHLEKLPFGENGALVVAEK